MKREVLDRLIAARAARRPVVRLTWLEQGREALIVPGEDESGDAVLAPAVAQAVRSDRGGVIETSEGAVFVHPFNPPIRLAIVGAVHVAQRLSVLARELGWAVTVIDPRTGFLSEARFPEVERRQTWPDEALEAFGLDPRSAVVTLSHDAKIDEPALGVALRSDCFYIGALGSRRTQARRRERLREAGHDDAALARIHGPVGLDLGARSPAEIALSIAAEICAVLRKSA